MCDAMHPMASLHIATEVISAVGNSCARVTSIARSLAVARLNRISYRRGKFQMQNKIFNTQADQVRLEQLLSFLSALKRPCIGHGNSLEARPPRATVAPSSSAGLPVVTMHSQVALRDVDSGTSMTFTLANPEECEL